MKYEISDLKKDIKNKSFKNLYFFYGEEKFLIDFYAKKIKELLVDEAFECFNFLNFDKDNENFDEFFNFIESFPQMSEKKVIILNKTSFFGTEEYKEKSKAVLVKLPDFVTVIIIEDKLGDLNSAVSKVIKEKSTMVEFPQQNDRDLCSWIRQQLSASNKAMDDDVMNYLIKICDNSLVKISTECEKLIHASGDEKFISRKLVDSTVNLSVTYKIYLITEFLFNGKKHEAYEIIKDLKKKNEEPLGLLSILYSQLSQMYMVYRLEREKDARPQDFMPQNQAFLVSKHLRNIKKINSEKLREIMKLCSKYDLDIKSGKIDGYCAIEVIIATIILCIENR